MISKKELELKCLNAAIKNCLAQKGLSKQVGKLMSGVDIERLSDERPDFLRYISPNNRKEKGVVVGIEHFMVDHISKEKKNDKYQSMGRIHQKKVSEFYDKWHDDVQASDQPPDGVLDELSKLLCDHFNNSAYATFRTFFESFKHAVDTHMKSIDVYDKAIRDAAEKREAEHKLIILIEIHSEFRDLFFHRNGEIKFERDPITIILDEFIQLLESADKRIDYYVLNFSDTLATTVQTITINAKDIRSSLKKQHIPIYHYCGSDLYLPKNSAFVMNYKMDINSEQNGENIDFDINPSMSMMKPEYEIKFIWNALRKAQYHLENKEEVILDMREENAFEIFAPYIVSWKKCDDDKWSYEPEFLMCPTPSEMEKAFAAFDKRWGITETKIMPE